MVADAMRAYPAWTSGTSRAERGLMAAVPGLLVKAGAEGVEVFAFADGSAGAVKIADGVRRAVTPVTVALLRALGVTTAPGAAGLGAGRDRRRPGDGRAAGPSAGARHAPRLRTPT